MIILIADDHPVVLLGLKSFLETKGYSIAGIYENGIQLYNQIKIKKPNLVISDISMPGLNGLEIAEKLQQENIKCKLILLTMHNELSMLNRAKELGVKGYLLKDFAMHEIEACIKEVLRGDEYFSQHLLNNVSIQKESNTNKLDVLTAAEKKIIKLIAEQKTTKDIAAMLFISEKTVEAHRSNIIKKLNIPSGKNNLVIWVTANEFFIKKEVSS